MLLHFAPAAAFVRHYVVNVSVLALPWRATGRNEQTNEGAYVGC